MRHRRRARYTRGEPVALPRRRALSRPARQAIRVPVASGGALRSHAFATSRTSVSPLLRTVRVSPADDRSVKPAACMSGRTGQPSRRASLSSASVSGLPGDLVHAYLWLMPTPRFGPLAGPQGSLGAQVRAHDLDSPALALNLTCTST